MPRSVGQRGRSFGHREGTCRTCTHLERTRIDWLICSGSPIKPLARKFGLPAGSVYWHIRHHISPEYRASITAGPFSSEEQLKKLVSENESSVLDTLKALNSGVLTKWLAAFESDALDGFINLTASARKNLELMAKLNHEIAPPGPTSVVTNNNTIVSIHQSPEYLQTISTLAIALRPFPEARQAVAAALKGIGGLPHQQRPAIVTLPLPAATSAE